MDFNNRPSVRWQETRIEQLGYVNYILLILCSGIFAFQSDAIIKNGLVNNIENSLFFQSIVFIFVSITIGCILAFNRLISFKITAKIARLNEKVKESNTVKKIKIYRIISNGILDRLTWMFISLQLLFFFFGIYKLLLFVLK